jgi:hypothetical protein
VRQQRLAFIDVVNEEEVQLAAFALIEKADQ